MTKQETYWLKPGTARDGCLYVEVKLKVDGEKRTLSLTGVVGPRANGNCRGSCGQVVDTLTETGFAPSDGWTPEMVAHLAEVWDRWHSNNMRPECMHQRAAGWREIACEQVPLFHWRLTPEVVAQASRAKRAAVEAAKRGDAHQSTPEDVRVLNLPWGRTTETDTPPSADYRPCPVDLGEGPITYNGLGWLRPDEHSRGILCKPCPTCGYKYGSAWLYEPLPEDVLTFLDSLPRVPGPRGWSHEA